MKTGHRPQPHGDPMREHVPDDSEGLVADAPDADRHERGEPEPEPHESKPSRPHGDPMRADTRNDKRSPDSRVN
jgi:hypothetical protein